MAKKCKKSCLELSTIAKENTVGNDPLKIRRNQIFSRHYECPNATISKTIEIDHVKQISECDRNYDIAANGTNSEKSRNGSMGEYKVTTTTTTKVIQTTVITKQSHRVGLVFNDSGELISNLDSLRNLNTNNKFNQLVSACNNNNNNSGKPSILDDDFDFIDDVSQSGSEGHINRLQSKNKCNTCHNQNKSKSDWNLSVKKQIKDELCEVVADMEGLDSQEDCKHSNKDKQMSIGRKKFNMDPKKGIEYLCENHQLQMNAKDIAHFLYKGEGLNKTAIGDYLGEKNDFNEQVLKAFVDLHDFTNLILVQALRQFLWSFRLPGEAQKIDRMMECFAQRYCQLNPDIFTNTDTCYVLSFAIIMLNTSLHNPSVKDKPTLDHFISMNRGINNGGDLPRELLESLYESIRTEPFKIPQDDGNDLMHTFFNPDKEGWLWKQGGRYKSWKRRWFILNDNCLYYFEYTTDKEPRGIIPLENISAPCFSSLSFFFLFLNNAISQNVQR